MEADALGAIVSLLLADAGVAALAGARVFGSELPAGEAGAMPRKAVIVRPSGGVSPVGGYAELTGNRIDVIALGETPFEAGRLSRAVFAALKPVRRRTVATGGETVLVHWVEEAGGRIAVRDTETDWPAAVQSFQLVYATQTLA